VGDFILTLPVLAALRRRFPNHALHILGHERSASLALAAGLADLIHPLEAPALAGFFARDSSLPAPAMQFFAGFELVVSYLYDPGKIFEANVARCTAARFLACPHRPDESAILHAASAMLRPLEALGITEPDPRPRLIFSARPEPSFQNTLAIHPGSGSPAKNWPESHWAAFLRLFAAKTAWRFLLIGGEAEGARCERLAAVLPLRRVRLAHNLPLVELAQTMRSCAAFMGHDSGIAHLAAALDLPGLVLWGPSNLAVWRPLSDQLRILRDARGLDALPVEKVLQAARHLGARP
jgi:ADP-heptose:LPS heptosyltransferase